MDPLNFDWLFMQLSEHWDDIADFFNSVFFTSIIGASLGAFWGARAAQETAEKSKRREQLVKEIRDTNAAMTVASSICGALLNVKNQHVLRLKAVYESDRRAFIEHKLRRDAGEIPRDVVYEFSADLQTLTLPPLPEEILQKIVFERISVIGRPLALATMVGQCVADLRMSIELRNSLIEEFKRKGPPLNAFLYFGLQQGDVVNEEYPASVNAISHQIDDCIFFSHLLVKDLMNHGTHTAAAFAKELGKGVPRVAVQDFSDAVEAGLMPDESNYPDWFKKFKKHEEPLTPISKARAWMNALAGSH